MAIMGLSIARCCNSKPDHITGQEHMQNIWLSSAITSETHPWTKRRHFLCVDRERDHCCIEDWIRRNMCSTENLHLHLELSESGP